MQRYAVICSEKKKMICRGSDLQCWAPLPFCFLLRYMQRYAVICSDRRHTTPYNDFQWFEVICGDGTDLQRHLNDLQGVCSDRQWCAAWHCSHGTDLQHHSLKQVQRCTERCSDVQWCAVMALICSATPYNDLQRGCLQQFAAICSGLQWFALLKTICSNLQGIPMCQGHCPCTSLLLPPPPFFFPFQNNHSS